MSDSTQRFSSRVENYVKYRPGYPDAVIELLREECGLTPRAMVADIGSGTGISSRLFLRNGNAVFGVEPNAKMRAAGEEFLREFPNFHSMDGKADATGLPEASIDLIVAAQAFHWFDPVATRGEWERILKPNGYAVLLWNARRETTTPFLAAYDELLVRYATDYSSINHKRIDDKAAGAFFAPCPFGFRSIDSEQVFDYEGLEGRLLSSSYTPEETDPRYAPLLQGLREIFDVYQEDGRVSFEYDTTVYWGRLSSNEN